MPDDGDLGEFDDYDAREAHEVLGGGPAESATDDAHRQLLAARPETATLVPGGLAFDLVTQQLLFVRRKVAENLAEYYEAEGFDLLNYKMHPYLPVRVDDAVYECVYCSEVTAQGLADWGDVKTYDFPAGRLAVVPVMEAWADAP